MTPALKMSTQANGLAEAHGRPRTTPNKSLWDLLQEGLAKNPDGLALACLHHPTDHLFPAEIQDRPNLEWTFAELSHHAEVLAQRIQESGAGLRGAVIAPFVPNGAEWALVFWAAAKLGMPIAALDPKMLEKNSDPEARKHYLATLKPRVVIVQDTAAGAVFDTACQYAGFVPKLKLVACISPDSKPLSDDWIYLHHLLSSPSPTSVSANGISTNGTHNDKLSNGVDEYLHHHDPSQEVARILFTGGSTGIPKGCPHTGANLTAESEGHLTMRGLTQHSRTLIQSPVHHIMANAAALLSWRAGAAIIFASPRFETGESLRAIQTYGCTYLPVHHSMTDALLRHPSFGTEACRSVRYMQVGGALIGPELAERYGRVFGGGGGLEMFPFWGSTEGMYTTACGKGDEVVCSEGLLSVGRVVEGGRVKVADPETHVTLPYDEVGELHFGGDTVIRNYCGDLSPGSFYRDANGCSWFKTGDQGRMNRERWVFMLGRYKDMIKRGGGNIFPQQVEYKLRSESKIETQIVGIPDAVTGEACVAVVDAAKSDNFSRLNLQAEVSKQLGSQFVFSHIFTLNELDLVAFPLGPGGKVRKPVLKEIILKRLHKQEKKAPASNGEISHGSHASVALIKSIWAKLLHVEISQLDDNGGGGFDMKHFMDSLTAMRYAFEIEKATSKQLTFADLQKAPTIREQATLLDRTPASAVGAGQPVNDDVQDGFCERVGPPGEHDIAVCHGKLAFLESIKKAAEQTLDQHGLTWDRDVLDCFPWPGFLSDLGNPSARRSDNLRFVFEIQGLDYRSIHGALVRAIKTQPLLTSLGVLWNKIALFLQLRYSDAVWDHIIHRGPDFDSVQDAVHYSLRTPDYIMTNMPNMLSRFAVSAVTGNNSHVLTISINHYCCDSFTNGPLFDEIEAQLNTIRFPSPNSNGTHTPLPTKMISYKLFADMSYLLSTSLTAQTSARILSKKLRGVSAHPAACWPRWQDVKEDNHHYQGHAQIRRFRKAPGILALAARHNIPPGIALKTAFAVAMTHMSGSDSALFASASAGRSWPFQDPWVRRRLPNPLYIGGPTVGISCDCIRVVCDDGEAESALSLMRRVHRDAAEFQERHVHAPGVLVMANLPEVDMRFLAERRKMLLFNYLPDVERFAGRGRIDSSSTADAGVINTTMRQCGVTCYASQPVSFQTGFLADDREVCAVAALVDETQWDLDDFGVFADRVLDVLQVISREENWERSVGESCGGLLHGPVKMRG